MMENIIEQQKPSSPLNCLISANKRVKSM